MFTAQKIAYHKHWLRVIRSSVKGLSYVSHTRQPSTGTYGIKVIRNGEETTYPIEGHPDGMIDENYRDFLRELNEA